MRRNLLLVIVGFAFSSCGDRLEKSRNRTSDCPSSTGDGGDHGGTASDDRTNEPTGDTDAPHSSDGAADAGEDETPLPPDGDPAPGDSVEVPDADPPAPCGNGECAADESSCTCPQDCQPETCGNGECCGAAGESNESCPEDCPAICGDDFCADGENPCSCPQDCGPEPCGNGVCCKSEGANESYLTCWQDCAGEIPARKLGAVCTNDSKCDSGRCNIGSSPDVCSTCKSNAQCPGNDCSRANCAYFRCGGPTAPCNPGD